MRRSSLLVAAAIGLGCLANLTHASLTAFDNASDPAYSGGGWVTGNNGGFGWGSAWTVNTPASPTFTGSYIGTSAGNGGSPNIDSAGAKAWAMYANTSNTAEASRSFNGNMTVGQQFSMDFDNGNVANGPDMSVGFSLRDAGSNNKLEFYARGLSNYLYSDLTGEHDSGISQTTGGVHLDFYLTGTDAYTLFINRKSDNAFTFVNGTLSGTSGSGVNIFRGFDFNPQSGGSSRDIFFNSMSVTPEPGALGLAAVAGLGLLRRGRRSKR